MHPFWHRFGGWLTLVATALLCIAPVAGQAASISLIVADTTGEPVADAIVAVLPHQPLPPGYDAGKWSTPLHAVMNQRDETFIPFILAVRRGGTVVFRNSDTTRHQVYSFAPIKQFQLVVEPGESSPPVEFDTVGSAALGCNIHDQMIAYLYVTEAPWTVVTGADGAAQIDGLPKGEYEVVVWHPRLKPGAPSPSRIVTLPTEQSIFTLKAAVLPPRILNRDDMNMY